MGTAPKNPKYLPWKSQLEKELTRLSGEVILIGHSLGGSVLLKYLSEEKSNRLISGLFLVAVPYWGEDDDWHSTEFTLAENFAEKIPRVSHLFAYHSSNDEVVPFAHFEHYIGMLPQIKPREIEGHDHLFSDGLPELINDIKVFNDN